MKHRNILIAIALLLTSCEGFQDKDPSLFATPEVTAVKAVVSDSSIAVELSGAISAIDCKAVKECGFYVSKDSWLSSKTIIAATVKEQFSANFSSEEFGTKYYYQAFISNGKYVITSETQSFEIKPFEYYVSVNKPELVGTELTVAKITVSVQFAEGLSLDEIGFQYSRNKDFSSLTEVAQTTDLDTITQDFEFEPGVEYHIRAYAKKGNNVVYSEAISVTVYCLPEVTTSSTVTGITPTSATCGGEVTADGGAQVTEYGFVYGTSQTPTIETATKKVVGKGTGSFSTTLTDLTTGSTYYVRAYATNSQGTAYGEEVSFKTAKSVTGISLDKTSLTLAKGASQTLTATISPSDAYDKAVSWSTSNSNIATVSNGKVTAITTGTATITATSHDGGFKANCTVTVTSSVSGISLNKKTLTLEKGSSETLVATITPADASNKTVIWTTSNSSVATVSSSGTVKAIATGSATITASTEDGSKKATCTITVISSVTSVSLNKTSLTLTQGASESLIATIKPSDATNKNVTWSTSSSAIATVSSSGTVKGVSPGTATITVTTKDGNKKANCTVTVKSNTVPVTSVALNKTSLTLTQGSSETLTAHIYPSNATNKNVIWSSSNSSVATVDINGTVKAIAAGSATITATTQDGYFKATCSVTVKSNIVPVTGIALNKSSLTLTQGGSETLTATIYPSNATNKSVTWSSSNTNIATVSSSGVVTAKAVGSTTITVTTSDGGKKATCTVTVTGTSPDTGRYITFETTSGENSIKYVNNGGNTVSLQYSFDGSQWYTWKPDTFLSFSRSKLYVRGDNPNGFSESNTRYSQFFFSSSNTVNCRGSIMNLLSYVTNVQLSSYCFTRLFYNCSCLLNSPELPATSLAYNCYSSMYYRCASLTSAPVLPATSLAPYCYSSMFEGCTSLTSAPVLPATSLASRCYLNMFQGCTSLTSAPQLPATSLAPYCYSSMFEGCTSLTSAPELPATSLDDYCYSSMFFGCTALISAPALPATSLASRCYLNMFQGCTSLTSAPVLPATSLAPYCYSSMFYRCTALKSTPQLLATSLADYCYDCMFCGCTALKSAPVILPATSLAPYCYSHMFQGCTSLNSAPELPATSLASGCYNSMFYGCTSLSYMKAMFIIKTGSITSWLSGVYPTGTFVKNRNATWSNDGIVPSGWTVEYADE